jgi:hypothetical protein
MIDQATATSLRADDSVPLATTPLVHRNHTVMGDPSTRGGKGTASVVIRWEYGTHNPDGTSFKGWRVRSATSTPEANQDEHLNGDLWELAVIREVRGLMNLRIKT